MQAQFLHHGSLLLQGYFQILFSCIERLLAFLNVKNLVLPAAEEAVAIWTDKFGFKKMKPNQVCYNAFARSVFQLAFKLPSYHTSVYHVAAYQIPKKLLSDGELQRDIHASENGSAMSSHQA